VVNLEADNSELLGCASFESEAQSTGTVVTVLDFDIEGDEQYLATGGMSAMGAVSTMSATAATRSMTIRTIRTSTSDIVTDELTKHSSVRETRWASMTRGFAGMTLRQHGTGASSDPRIDYPIGVIIAVNCLCIGGQIQFSLEGRKTFVFDVLEHVFLCIYLLEMGVRIYCQGAKAYFTNRWCLFDSILVGIGIVGQWIMTPISMIQSGSRDSTPEDRIMKQIMILRVLRLLRLCRILRVVALFQDLWRLVNGLMESAGAILSTFILLTICIYLFACIGVELITNSEDLQNDPELSLVVHTHFHSLYGTMVTLCRFIAFDSVGAIYEPLVWRHPFLLLYFCMIAMVVSISLMNLITAILVDTAINQTHEDPSLRRRRIKDKVKRLIPQVEQLFHELDSDEDLFICSDNILEGHFKVPPGLEEMLLDFPLIEVFGALHGDTTGYLDKNTFVQGLITMSLSESSVLLTRLLYHMQMLKRHVDLIPTHRSETPHAAVGQSGPMLSQGQQFIFEQDEANDRVSKEIPKQRSETSHLAMDQSGSMHSQGQRFEQDESNDSVHKESLADAAAADPFGQWW